MTNKFPYFYSTDDFPQLWPLERNYRAILDEYNGLDKSQFVQWPQSSINHDQGWTVFGLISFGKIEENSKLCPKTLEFLKAINATTGGFSKLKANTDVKAHVGYPGYSRYHLRCHLALELPKDSYACGIRVGLDVKHYQLGRTIIFDDLYEHKTWNLSNSDRVVLLFDIRNPFYTEEPPVPLEKVRDFFESEFNLASELLPALKGIGRLVRPTSV